MIRPGAMAALRRWREALIGAAVAGFGLWVGLVSYGYVTWIGGALVLLGLALVVTGIQRGRFRTGAGGVGVVRVTEGQIGYFGPFTGGAVALSEIRRLALDVGPGTAPAWRLSQHGQPDLLIPLDAEGADALFDIFAALPGIRTTRLVAEVQRAMSGRAEGGHGAAETGAGGRSPGAGPSGSSRPSGAADPSGSPGAGALRAVPSGPAAARAGGTARSVVIWERAQRRLH